jgi:hypothetical protein
MIVLEVLLNIFTFLKFNSKVRIKHCSGLHVLDVFLLLRYFIPFVVLMLVRCRYNSPFLPFISACPSCAQHCGRNEGCLCFCRTSDVRQEQTNFHLHMDNLYSLSALTEILFTVSIWTLFSVIGLSREISEIHIIKNGQFFRTLVSNLRVTNILHQTGWSSGSNLDLHYWDRISGGTLSILRYFVVYLSTSNQILV